MSKEANCQDLRNWSALAYRAMDEAFVVIETIDTESEFEAASLIALRAKLRDLCSQALTLHGVISRSQLDLKFPFGRIDLEGGAA